MTAGSKSWPSAMTILLGETRARGEVLETIVHDTTKVGHPPAASIFAMDGRLVVVPTSPQFPVLERDTVGDAIAVVERMVDSD